MLHVVVAVLRAQGKVLIAQRQSHQHLGGLWEFPGGKVEAGEQPKAALVRELQEELGLSLSSDLFFPLIEIPFYYPDKSVLLDVYVAEVAEAELLQAQGQEGQPVRLVPQQELANYQFPEANQQILAALAQQ